VAILISMADDQLDGRCIDCGTEVTFVVPDEFFMVHDELWLRANPAGNGKLCVGCLEARIARKLEPADFIDAPINKRYDAMTERLRSRISGKLDGA
jgi:hypothetical protein